jgi:membrane protein DedA with SNARE-associated domain
VLARYLGRAAIYGFADSRWGRLCLLSSDKMLHAEDYFRRHGIVSTFFGRLVPAVRQLISIPAGLSRMPFATFLLYTTLGAGCWNLVLATLGWVVFKSFPDLKTPADVAAKASDYSHEIGYVILLLVLVVLLVVAYKTFRKKASRTSR